MFDPLIGMIYYNPGDPIHVFRLPTVSVPPSKETAADVAQVAGPATPW